MRALKLILAARPDLQDLVSEAAGEQAPPVDLWAWMLRAFSEGTLDAIVDDREWLTLVQRPAADGLTVLQLLVWAVRPDVQVAYPEPDAGAYLQWFHRHGVREMHLWPFLDAAERADVLLASEGDEAMAVRQEALAWAAREEALAALAPAPAFGVNVVGYAYGQLGIGEDARMAARALLHAGVPTCLVDFPPGRRVPQHDRSLHDHVAAQPRYGFNLVCLTASEHARLYLERGRGPLRGRYNIGYWPWELSRWPEAWKASLDLVDEVWVSSKHIQRALQQALLSSARSVPVRCMPMAVDVAERQSQSRSGVRRHFGLPPQACVFCFAFDLNSYVHRKNPQAVLEAFQRAFPPGSPLAQRVRLLIKTHRPAWRSPEWTRLKALARADKRLHLVEQTLPRSELLALYAACDCMVSLHRAEGFGRNIAEALQLGLHVVTTRYSGNLDFCEAPELRNQVDLVPAHLVPVGPEQYPYGEGQVWAEPSAGHAVWFMRAFAARHASGFRHAPPPEGGWPRFGLEEVGARYAERLHGLWRRGAVASAVFAGG